MIAYRFLERERDGDEIKEECDYVLIDTDLGEE